MHRQARVPYDNPVDMRKEPGTPHPDLERFRYELKEMCLLRMEHSSLRHKSYDKRFSKSELSPEQTMEISPKPWTDNSTPFLQTLKTEISKQGARFIPMDPSKPCSIEMLPNEMLSKIIEYTIYGEDLLELERIGMVNRHFQAFTRSSLVYKSIYEKALPDSERLPNNSISFRELYFTTPHPYFNGYYSVRTNEATIDSCYPPNGNHKIPEDYYFFYRTLRLYPDGKAIFSEISEEYGTTVTEQRVKQFRRGFKGTFKLEGDHMVVEVSRGIAMTHARFNYALQQEEYISVNGTESHFFEFQMIPDDKHRYDLHYLKARFTRVYENGRDGRNANRDTPKFPPLKFFFNTEHIHLDVNF